MGAENGMRICHLEPGNIGALVQKVLAREKNPSMMMDQLPSMFAKIAQSSGLSKGYNDYFTWRYSSDKSVLVLPVMGEMTPYSTWYSLGADFYEKALMSAQQDSEYVGAVLWIDSGGGMADGCAKFASAITEFKKVKPILSQFSYCASAAYYAASQCDEAWIEDQAPSMVGSIGTLGFLVSYAKQLEQEGIDVRVKRATKSYDKASLNPYEELPADDSPEMKEYQALLDACQKEFEGAVKRGRAGKLKSDEVFTGKMYGANDALRLGLVDKKGSLSGAVKRVIQLSKS